MAICIIVVIFLHKSSPDKKKQLSVYMYLHPLNLFSFFPLAGFVGSVKGEEDTSSSSDEVETATSQKVIDFRNNLLKALHPVKFIKLRTL